MPVGNKSIITWLYICIAMVVCMVFIGGITRLTDSGLSMVDWKPLMGAIPPLNELQWQEMFNKYKAFPEYQKINAGMLLSDFKQIFFWEYFHRLWGRLIGIVFLVPLLFFLVKKSLSVSQIKKYTFALFLGGAQGLMGWYMVKSGLVDRPDVSHFRLCAHLILAFAIISYLYYLVLELKYSSHLTIKSSYIKYFVIFVFVLIFFQIAWGALVAGLDAGLTHNTFPKMGRHWIPVGLAEGSFFYNPVTLQFTHRYLGVICLISVFLLWFKTSRIPNDKLKQSCKYLVFMVLLQFFLGVVTLLSYVDIKLASAHQMGAVIIVMLATRLLFLCFNDQRKIT